MYGGVENLKCQHTHMISFMMFFGRSFALSENHAQWGFAAFIDGEVSLVDFDDRELRAVATVLSVEPVEPVTRRITLPLPRNVIGANDNIGPWEGCCNVRALNFICTSQFRVVYPFRLYVYPSLKDNFRMTSCPTVPDEHSMLLSPCNMGKTCSRNLSE